MDWNPISFEPNLKFVLELQTEDLKRQYYKQHEKAKQTLKQFSMFLQNIYNHHQKLLSDNIELFILNEKLQFIVNKCQSNPKVIADNDSQSSENQGAHKSCDKKILSDELNVCNKLDNTIFNKHVCSRKENISEHVPIFSCDFYSDVEDDISHKCNSPSRSITSSPTKIQNSPILSKRKKFNSKKKYSISNTSSHSSHVNSSNESKLNITNTVSILEKNINYSNSDLGRDSENVLNKEPLQGLENTVLSGTSCDSDKNKNCKLLSVSKSNYARTEYLDNGKKLKQTVLTYKKVIPIIDISKTGDDENDQSFVTDNKFSKKNICINECNKQGSKDKNLNTLEHSRKLSETKSNKIICSSNLNTENQDASAVDDELIEISPVHHEKLRLRNKLNFPKSSKLKTNIKSPIGKINKNLFDVNSIHYDTSVCLNEELKNKESKKIKKFVSGTTIKNKTNNKQRKKQTSSFEVLKENRKSLTSQKTFSDDTYFSPAEAGNVRNLEDYKMNITEFEEEEEENESPPFKKILLNSFDVIPGRNAKSPDFVYKEAPVRKKNEKAQLPGWECRDCEKWYGHMSKEEREAHQNQCSKHRGKFKPDILTPDSFWNPGFDDTNNSSLQSN